MRYAVEYRTYGLFQTHTPSSYLIVPQEGPVAMYNTYGFASRRR